MQNKILIVIGVAAVIAVGLLLFVIKQPTLNNGDKVKVAATIFSLADIAENIGGDKVEVVNIIKPGASPHTFEVNPSDVKRMHGVELLFAVGGGLDDWTADILSVDESIDLIVVGDGVMKKEFQFEHHHHEKTDHAESNVTHEHEHDVLNENDKDYDPHYWLSVKNAKIIAENIAESLIELDPDNAQFYRDNLSTYQQDLDQAANEIGETLKNLDKNKLIVFHESWNYFADEFGLEVVGVFALSPGKEPTPQQLAHLYDTARQYEVRAIFSEPQLSPETLRPFVEDLDLELYVLDPLGGIGERGSYINLLKYNAQTIKQALQ